MFLIHVEYQLFGDDMKLYFNINSLRSVQLLQNNLNNLQYYCDANLLLLKISKCSVLTMTRKKDPVLFYYKLNDAIIKRSKCVKSLGLLVDQKLIFDYYIQKIVSSAVRML